MQRIKNMINFRHDKFQICSKNFHIKPMDPRIKLMTQCCFSQSTLPNPPVFHPPYFTPTESKSPAVKNLATDSIKEMGGGVLN